MAEYCDLAGLKKSLELTGETYADDDLRLAITAASRSVDAHCGRGFGLADGDATRTYVPHRSDWVEIDDLVELTSVDSDLGQTGEYSAPWTALTDYRLEPLNAAADGEPYTILRLGLDSMYNPFDWGIGTVRVTGVFGWPAVPPSVEEATRILSARLLKRVREAPFGIAGMGTDGYAVRVSASDPDVSMLLRPFTRSVRLS